MTTEPRIVSGFFWDFFSKQMNNIYKNNIDKELAFIEMICNKAFETVTNDFCIYTNNILTLSKAEKYVIDTGFTFLQKKYIISLKQSLSLAQKAYANEGFNKNRIVYHNAIMKRYKNDIVKHFPPAANIWILDGIVIEKQIGGLKKLVGMSEKDGFVIDVLNSASSLDLGAENPWLIRADQTEDYLGIKDNFATIYHPSIRHAFALNKLAELYPGKQKTENITVHIESSGAISNSIAIESVAAYMEKRGIVNGKILAVDGTWAGGYGSAREATGFGINQQTQKRRNKNIWIDRCLPVPTKDNMIPFLNIIKKKLKTGNVAGLFIEPDIIADLGVLNVDEQVIKEVIDIFQKLQLPIILDCIQQIGRTGSYWGNYVDRIFKNISLLVVTAAKSAANGQPLSFTLMPNIIAKAAYPLTQLTTNQMNGPLLRTLVVSEILKNQTFQEWIKQKSDDIETIASKYGVPIGTNGLRGKFLNRGIYVGDNEQVKLAQIALFIEDGILTGAFPQTIRYQPMLLELSETNRLIAEVILRKVAKVQKGDVSKEVSKIYNKMKNVVSGLAREAV